MDFVLDSLEKWMRNLLYSGIRFNLQGVFGVANLQVEEARIYAGTPPQSWNPTIYNMIHDLSQTVILPIAGLILAFVATLELIQIITEKNNMHDIDTWIFFKWIFKTAAAVLIVSNTWTIVMGIFEASQNVVNSASGVLIGSTDLSIDSVMENLEPTLDGMGLGSVFGFFMQSGLIRTLSMVLPVLIMIIAYARMIEIYLVTSLAPIPMATMTHQEWGQIGKNYLRSMLALAFQGFLLMVCIAIYTVLVSNIPHEEDILRAAWSCMGYMILLCFTMFKTGSLSKSIFHAS